MAVWKDVVGYEGLYQVSSDGQVYGCKRKKFLAQIEGQAGHLWVGLWKNNRYKARYVHQLVLEAFVGPRPPRCEACHYPDRNPANNNVTNLSWGTKKRNAKHRTLHGKTVRGERFWSAKLDKKKVRKARRLYETGRFTIRGLAGRFGIASSSMRSILNRQTWKHVA